MPQPISHAKIVFSGTVVEPTILAGTMLSIAVMAVNLASVSYIMALFSLTDLQNHLTAETDYSARFLHSYIQRRYLR